MKPARNQVFLLFMCSIFIFAGCASTVPVNKQQTALIPDLVALKILGRRLSPEWASNPYIEKRGFCVFPALVEKSRISISDIKEIRFNQSIGLFMVTTEPPVATFFSGCSTSISFKLDSEAALEVATALRALGACTQPKSSC